MAEEQVLNTHNAEILLRRKSHYPQDDFPEAALAGRSKMPVNQAYQYISWSKPRTYFGKPGKLSCLISTILTTSYALWMPGHGYARVSKKERAKMENDWGVFGDSRQLGGC